VDYGSRDALFTDIAAEVRERLLRAAATSKEKGFECVLMQGCGSMGVESVLGSSVPRENGKVLIVVNGSYGVRQADMCRTLGIQHECLNFESHEAVRVEDLLKKVREVASAGSAFTHVSVVHHETTAGVINPLQEMTKALKAEFPDIILIVDSMSGFGSYELRMDWGIDFAVSSSNKCFEGVPGFSFALCKREALVACEGRARSVSLDLFGQWKFFEEQAQFRFTPPTQSVAAFRRAMMEWEEEGGFVGRSARYTANYECMKREMLAMGFKFYVPEECRSNLVSSFIVPDHPKFKLATFCDKLIERGFVIYPGKVAGVETFRVCSIGQLFPEDCQLLMDACRRVCADMGVELPLQG